MKKTVAFTLVEILIAVSVIAILAILTLVGYQSYQSRAEDADVKNTASQLEKKAETFKANNSDSLICASDCDNPDEIANTYKFGDVYPEKADIYMLTQIDEEEYNKRRVMIFYNNTADPMCDSGVAILSIAAWSNKDNVWNVTNVYNTRASSPVTSSVADDPSYPMAVTANGRCGATEM